MLVASELPSDSSDVSSTFTKLRVYLLPLPVFPERCISFTPFSLGRPGSCPNSNVLGVAVPTCLDVHILLDDPGLDT